MLLSPCLIALALAGQPLSSAFDLIDVEAVEGRPLNRYRALELGERPVRPISWEVAPPRGVRYGLVPVGPDFDRAPAVAWDAEGASLWLDSDGDRRFAREERREVKPGTTTAITATIPATIAGARPGRRTILVRPGLLGRGPRYTVRGGMAGSLDLSGKAVRAILIDEDADGGFATAGTDRVWADLDGDGRFDPVAEQFPLGSPIPFGGTSYTVASDHRARAVSAHERDPRVGRLRAALGGRTPPAKVVEVAANLVGDTGGLVTIRAIDAPTEAPVGRYRVAGLSLQLADDSGQIWSYTFAGGRAGTIEVTPGAETRVDLLDGLAFEVAADAPGGARPGDEVEATPHLHLGSGLYLANCTTRRGDGAREQDRSARIALKGPEGSSLDQAVSGFA